MRVARTASHSVAASSDRLWSPGLPHIVAVAPIWPVFGAPAFVAGLILASLASFIVYLPLTALTLNKGAPIAEDAPAPELTRPAQTVLLTLWIATTWLGAVLSMRSLG